MFRSNKITVLFAIVLMGIFITVTGCDETTTDEDTGTGSTDTSDSSETDTGDTDSGSGSGSDVVDTDYSYSIIDTGQILYYNNTSEMTAPASGSDFFGQDGSYAGAQPSYQNNSDGTITDLKTGLMWQQDPGDKMGYTDAVSNLTTFSLAGYSDWRLPTIKELYSLILFSGLDPSGYEGSDTSGLVPFIDTDYFTFEYGDESNDERIIDSQYMSSTKYVSTTMNGDETLFGVNFADGRIKGYPLSMRGSDKLFFVMYVRSNTDYGTNNFSDNGNNTITDAATGLMWMTEDSGSLSAGDNSDGALTWEQALEWSETLDYAGHTDWRLPNAKELQSLVDYTRSPATTGSAAIDPLFTSTAVLDEGGETNYPFYWTGTTHANMTGGSQAAYIAFGEALGWMESPSGGDYTLMDVHGAGSQRSDPKIGDPSDYPYGFGPQGDVRRIYNYVRCVRDAN